MPSPGASTTIDPGGGGEQLAAVLGRERLAGLHVDRLRVTDEDRHPDAGRRDPELVVGGAEDLARLGHHLALLGRVVVAVGERLDLGQDVEGDPVRDRPRPPAPSPSRIARDWARSSVDRAPAGAGDRLVGGDDDPLDPDRALDRRQRDHHLHRRAVGVRDQPAVALDRIRVDLGDDQRHLVVHAPEAGVVDHDRAGVDEARRPLGADRPAGRGEHQVEPGDRLGGQRPALELARRRRRSSGPAERSEANGTTSEAGKPRSASTSRIVEPTAPVAPTTPTR